MVVCGDFEVHLVEATSKTPYKEHQTDDQVYVEVEPNAEYFLSIQRVGNDIKDNVDAEFFVDDQDFGWSRRYSTQTQEDQPEYFGLYQRHDGMKSHKALKFVKPQIEIREGIERSEPFIGKVEVKVHKLSGTRKRKTPQKRDKMPELKAPAVPGSGSQLAKAKVVRSGVGDFSSIPYTSVYSGYIDVRVALLQTITLNYCTVPGLMHVGVIAKSPNAIEAYTTMNPHKRLTVIPANAIQPKRTRITKTMQVDGRQVVTEDTYINTYDLTELPSSDDEEADDDEAGPKNLPGAAAAIMLI